MVVGMKATTKTDRNSQLKLWSLITTLSVTVRKGFNNKIDWNFYFIENMFIKINKIYFLR